MCLCKETGTFLCTRTSFILTFWPTSIFTPFMVLALLWECCFVCIYTVYLFGKELEPSHEIRVQMLMFRPLLCWPQCFLWACWCWAQTLPSFSSSCAVDEVVVFSRLLLSFKTCILKDVSSQWETVLLKCELVKFAYCGEWGKMSVSVSEYILFLNIFLILIYNQDIILIF